MTGRDYWLLTLAPYARDGYDHGEFDDLEVVLRDEAGAEVHLPRPSGTWVPASLAVPAMEPDNQDLDPEELRGLRYVMERPGRDRMELQV